MYNKDQKAISRMARNSIEFTNWLVVMVLVSIRTPWINIVMNMIDVKRDGADAVILNNKSKNKGYKYIRTHAKSIHNTIFNDHMTTEEKLVALCDIPNIALVKAGFILQLCVGEVGCIDCHNATKHGVDLGKLKVGSNATLATKLKKAKVYNEVCKKAGGSEFLWNSWCSDRYKSSMARKLAKNRFKSPRHVSQHHLDAVISVVKR